MTDITKKQNTDLATQYDDGFMGGGVGEQQSEGSLRLTCYMYQGSPQEDEAFGDIGAKRGNLICTATETVISSKFMPVPKTARKYWWFIDDEKVFHRFDNEDDCPLETKWTLGPNQKEGDNPEVPPQAQAAWEVMIASESDDLPRWFTFKKTSFSAYRELDRKERIRATLRKGPGVYEMEPVRKENKDGKPYLVPTPKLLTPVNQEADDVELKEKALSFFHLFQQAKAAGQDTRPTGHTDEEPTPVATGEGGEKPSYENHAEPGSYEDDDCPI